MVYEQITYPEHEVIEWTAADGRRMVGTDVDDERLEHWFTLVVRKYVWELEDGGMVNPLDATLSVAAMLDDLYRIGGIEPPAVIRERLEA